MLMLVNVGGVISGIEVTLRGVENPAPSNWKVSQDIELDASS